MLRKCEFIWLAAGMPGRFDHVDSPAFVALVGQAVADCMTDLKLTIKLKRDLDSGDWFVDRIDAKLERMQFSTRFTPAYPLHLAFRPEVVETMQAHLPIYPAHSVAAIDEIHFRQMDLSLLGVRVIAQKALAGMQSAVISVLHVVGSVQKILSDRLIAEAGFLPNLSTQSSLNG